MLSWITTVLPWVIGAVRWAEQFFGPKTGDQKLKAVLDLFRLSFPTEGDSEAQAKALEGVKMIVNGIVIVLNATGVFTRSTT